MRIPAPISVLVADDDDSLRATIASALNTEPDIVVVGEASNGAEAVEKSRSLGPDIVIMDISMSRLDGIAATGQIVESKLGPKVVIVTHLDDDQYIHRCMEAGASGYVLKNVIATELAKSIRVVHKGGHFFSPRIAQRIVKFYLDQVLPVESW
ncbi:MAG TPA: hypothetical protein DGH68_07215 [Bacteroidetes bacterium]|jgi:DNA-binding NarL/FixJ family response regulator|nr:hypothetical protein [Bacteroidota bacterium]